MADTKNKAVTYRRAIWFAKEQQGNNLGALLADAFAKYPDVKDTRWQDGTKKISIQNQKTSGTTCHMHIVALSEGESASVVKKDHVVGKEQLGKLAPPAEADFLDTDAFVRVEDNHVFICTNRMREKTVAFILHYILTTKIDAQKGNFSLERAAERTKLGELIKSGVKCIELDVSEFAVELDDQKGQSKSAISNIAHVVRSIFEEDSSPDQLKDIARIQSKVVYQVDGRGGGGVAADQLLADLAYGVLDDGEEGYDGFTIHTRDGNVITADEIAVRRVYNIPRDGKTLDREAAWQALDKCADELKATGICAA